MEFVHEPVLLNEVLEGLQIIEGGSYMDGTLGGAGHSTRILQRAGIHGRLYGFDQDQEALNAASQRLAEAPGEKHIYHSNYENAVRVLKAEGVDGVDGILLDLGVSSYQLDNPERGFSYRFDAPLDMRMDRGNALSAEEIVNEWAEDRLKFILKTYGEEKCASAIAREIVKKRKDHRICTTAELNEIIAACIPAKMRQSGGHPSKRSFQAIRIACNRELEVLENSLEEMIDFLHPGGRMAVITFHSLEDRIVKQIFRRAEAPCICPPDFPICTCGRVSKGKCVPRGAILPTEEEQERNPRAKSAKLRVFEKGGVTV